MFSLSQGMPVATEILLGAIQNKEKSESGMFAQFPFIELPLSCHASMPSHTQS